MSNVNKVFIIIGIVVLLVLAVAVSSYFLFYYGCSGEQSSKEKSIVSTEESDQDSVPTVTMSLLIGYLQKNSKYEDVEFKYLDSTDSIQITYVNVESDDYKEIFVIQDSNAGILYVRDTNSWDGLSSETSLFTIPLNVGDTYGDVYQKVYECVDSYRLTIPDDIGDAKDFGEDVTITRNPDGTISISGQ